MRPLCRYCSSLFLASLAFLVFSSVCDATAIHLTKFSGRAASDTHRKVQEDTVMDIQQVTRENKKESDANITCNYGEKNAPVGRYIGLELALYLVMLVTVAGIVIVGGFLLYPFFSYTSFAVVWATMPMLLDYIRRQWPSWDYLGPGNLYERGTTANSYILGTYIYLAVINKIVIFVFSVVTFIYSWKAGDEGETEGIRMERIGAIVGFIIAQGLSASSTYYIFEHGAPSFFRGSQNSLNADSCSGPQTWSQLKPIQRFTELALYLGPIVGCIPVIGTIWDIAEITCSIIVITMQGSTFAKTNAAIAVVTSILQFIVSVRTSLQSLLE